MTANFSIIHSDCIDALSSMQSSSMDAIVTDPPYGLSESPDPVKVMQAWCNGEDYHHQKKGFMGAAWDAFVPQPRVWKEALRVLKPGGYALVFAGSRTQDWMAMSLRFAGFEVVDTIMWVYAQGMPKSHNIGKAVRRLSEHGAEWDGWGTQLKPAYEPILVCRKPFKGTFAANVIKHGVGGINIDACRVPIDSMLDESQLRHMNRGQRGADQNGQQWGFSKTSGDTPPVVRPDGRWPANFVHDGSEAVLDLFPDSNGQQGAERFFFCAKPSSKERHYGMEHPGKRFTHGATLRKMESAEKRGNHHPTVKPIALMRWLVRLVCPAGGQVLDLYCGSGTTGIAAIQEGFGFVGIEREADFASISKARCSYAWQRRTGEKSERQKRRDTARKSGKFRYRQGDQMQLLLAA